MNSKLFASAGAIFVVFAVAMFVGYGVVDSEEDPVAAEASSVLTYTYNSDGTATVKDCDTSAAGSLTIPSTVTYNGTTYTVTTIGLSAFHSRDALTSVTIPDSVTTIELCAFYSCDALTSVTIGKSVTTIGYSAFSECSSLTSVTIPDSVTTIESDAFRYCTKLTSVTIGKSVKSIGTNAFRNCTELSTVYNASSLNIGVGKTTYGYVAYYAKEVNYVLAIDDPNTQYVISGQTVSFTASASSNNGSAPVAYSVSSVPDGFTVTVSGSTVTIKCPTVTEIKDYTFTLTASASGYVSASTDVTVHMVPVLNFLNTPAAGIIIS